MEGLGIIIFISALLIFGIPVILLIVGLSRMRTNRNAGKTILIVGAAWLIIAGGTCASLLMA